MILQALHRYYERAEDLPRVGWIRRGVDYVIVLSEQGDCVQIVAVSEQRKGKTIPHEMLVPNIGKQAMKHTNSGDDANLLWDNANFVLGIGKKGQTKVASFIGTLRDWLGDVDDVGVRAVDRFIQGLRDDPQAARMLISHFGVGDDFEKRNPALAFQLQGDVEPVHARPAVEQAIESKLVRRQTDAGLRGTCLVTGAMDVPLAPNESVIKGVWGGQTAGCNIVSFNARAFESYGKRARNGENAPISQRASFAYTTALNHLLASKQRMQVGDTSTVFWAAEPHELEKLMPDLFGEAPMDDPDRQTDALRALYTAVVSGRFSIGGPETRFHVLGLAPNAARIAVRFFETGTAMELACRIKQHFDDIAIAHSSRDPKHVSLFRLLAGVAVQGKGDNIPPNVGGEVMRAILEALPYPTTLMNLAVSRCRAEQGPTYPRAAALKASLNRWSRFYHRQEEEFTPMLDVANPNPAYRLGRLFAVLERIQEDAAGGPGKLNATIRDRYYGAASSTPAAVFSTLLRLSKHHLAKLAAGLAVTRERQIGQIMDGFDAALFPPRILPLPDQARFALGYYHQRQAFFSKATDSQSTEGESA